jgi:hypothetical protein
MAHPTLWDKGPVVNFVDGPPPANRLGKLIQVQTPDARYFKLRVCQRGLGLGWRPGVLWRDLVDVRKCVGRDAGADDRGTCKS